MKLFIYNKFYCPSSTSRLHSKENELCLFLGSQSGSIWWRECDQPFINKDDVKKLILDKFGLISDISYRGNNFVRFTITEEFGMYLKLKQNHCLYLEFEFQ